MRRQRAELAEGLNHPVSAECNGLSHVERDDPANGWFIRDDPPVRPRFTDRRAEVGGALPGPGVPGGGPQ